MESDGEIEGYSSIFTIKVIDFEDAMEDVLTVEEIHNLIRDKLQELQDLPLDEKVDHLSSGCLHCPV